MVERGELPGWTAPTRIVRIRPNRWVVLIAALIAFLSLVMDVLTVVDRSVTVVHGAVATSATPSTATPTTVGSTTYRTNVQVASPVLAPAPTTPPSGTYPATPAASGGVVCGQPILNSIYAPGANTPLGTTTAVVQVATNYGGSYNGTNTTYYFAPGVHNSGQLQMGTNDWYVGEFSGGTMTTVQASGGSQYGFTTPYPSPAGNDTVEYMTVQGFTTYGLGFSWANVAPFPVGATGGLTALYDTAQFNYPGTGFDAGSNSIFEHDCMTSNGDYGLNSYCQPATCPNLSATTSGPQDVTFEFNEVSFNDACNWELVPREFLTSPIPPAGCYTLSGSTLSAPLTTSGPITTIATSAFSASQAILPNSYVLLTSGSNSQAFYTTSGETSGQTSITVVSQTPNFAYPSGTAVNFTASFNLCGCAGGIHFWNNDGDIVANNYIHDNGDVGSWWDTNNNAEYIANNYFSNNFDSGVDIEISYNAEIINNNFVGNGVGRGACGGGPTVCNLAGNLSPAIYDSESGGTGSPIGQSSWPTGTPIDQFVISGNNFSNNWDGINSYEIPDRFAGSVNNTSKDYGTLGIPASSFTGFWDPATTVPSTPFYPNYAATGGGCGQANLTGAVPGASPDYWQNCWWKVSQVSVTNNTFSMNASAIVGDGTTGSTVVCSTTTSAICGMNAMYQDAGSIPAYSPYTTFASGQGMWAEMNNCTTPTFSGCVPLNNSYSSNAYTHTGSQNWRFLDAVKVTLTIAQWQAAGWDTGSTFT